MRWVLGGLGLALLAWGAWLLAPVLVGDPVGVGAWLVGGPVLHDAVLAPVVGLLGLLVRTRLPVHWRAPVTTGLVVSAVLGALSVPWLWRSFAPYTNPGLHDRNVLLGLVVALAVVWLTVATVAAVCGRVRARAGR